MLENPFIIGKIVLGDNFCNREKEIAQLCHIARSKQHMVIISPRRYGKTSLVIHALESNRVPFLYIDCTVAEDERSLVNVIANEYASKLDNIAVLDKELRKINITFSITTN